MRILFLTHRLPYAPNRGDRIRAYHLLREMARFAEVSLFSLVHDDEEMSHRDRVPFAHDVTTQRVRRLPNLARGAMRLGSDRPLTHSLLDADGSRAALRKMVADRSPDLVVGFCSGMARYAFEPPLDDRPFVLDMVDVDSVKWERLAKVTRGPVRWIYRREARTLRAFEAAAAMRARTTLVVNERERGALQAIAPAARVLIVPSGIDVDAFRPSDPPVGTPAVVFCGVMNYVPNEHGVGWFAAEVWPLVRAAIPSATFSIVGTSPTRAVKRLAARDSSIRVVGRVPSVQPYLWSSAVSVAPLLLAQGIQTKVFEALASGLPVVVTPAVAAGLPPEVQRICPTAIDPRGFADAVIALLRSTPHERRRHAASAPLDSLAWSEQMRGLEAILREGVSQTARVSTSAGSFSNSHS
ncbi:MAG TPA: TIGR03087 family PEP-CTERM/XrtA system glycosyltransferase [Vicinamibacterales bacterium]|nr:TIGR03087 family PEP-CTERM/XrtA system glycosyltransferase [Vicinamibacterales bacterium]